MSTKIPTYSVDNLGKIKFISDYFLYCVLVLDTSSVII